DNKKGYWASHGPEYPEFACHYNLVVTGNGNEWRHDRLPYGQQRTCQNQPIPAVGGLVDGDWPVFSGHVIAKRPPGRFCTERIFCSRTTPQTVNQSVNPAQSASI